MTPVDVKLLRDNIDTVLDNLSVPLTERSTTLYRGMSQLIAFDAMLEKPLLDYPTKTAYFRCDCDTAGCDTFSVVMFSKQGISLLVASRTRTSTLLLRDAEDLLHHIESIEALQTDAQQAVMEAATHLWPDEVIRVPNSELN